MDKMILFLSKAVWECFRQLLSVAASGSDIAVVKMLVVFHIYLYCSSPPGLQLCLWKV